MREAGELGPGPALEAMPGRWRRRVAIGHNTFALVHALAELQSSASASA